MATRSFSKRTIAREQLEDGIALFLDKRYVSALTLLGAAEEILSRLVEEQTGSHPLEEMWKFSNRMRTRLGTPHISKAATFNIFNRGRNTVKHHTPGETIRVSLNRYDEALSIIQRATASADYLHLRYRNKKAYNDWLRDVGFYDYSLPKSKETNAA